MAKDWNESWKWINEDWLLTRRQPGADCSHKEQDHSMVKCSNSEVYCPTEDEKTEQLVKPLVD